MRRFLEIVMVSGIIASAIALSGGYRLFAECSLGIAVLAACGRKWCPWHEMEMQCAAGSGAPSGVSSNTAVEYGDSGEIASSDAD